MAILKIGDLRVRMEGRVNREEAGVYHPSNPCVQERQRVTNMKKGFQNKNTFNEDISGWDVSSVTNMWALFK